MKKKKLFARILAAILAVSLMPISQPMGVAEAAGTSREGTAASGEMRTMEGTVRESELPQPAYFWDFEGVQNGNVVNKAATENGTAVMKGIAVTEQSAIAIGDKNYSTESNSVLSLAGGDKGTSWVELPTDLYDGVSADTGLTWSFWMKADPDIVKYSRLFSSTDSSNKNEFTYTPYANDAVWNLNFDDGSQYQQIHDTEPAKGVWNYITITVSKTESVLYVNGDRTLSTVKKGTASVLTNRLNGLASFTNHALGKTTSTWTNADCKVKLDDVAVYKTALTQAQAEALAQSYGLNANYNYYEGEDGILEGTNTGRMVETNTFASNGKHVGWLGKDNKGVLTMENIQAGVSGTYNIRLYYVSGAARSLYLKVNEGDPMHLDNLMSKKDDWKSVAITSVSIPLKQGSNTIQFYNESDNAPSIDRIAVPKTDISNANVQLSQEEYSYTGEECRPDVVVSMDDGQEIHKDDYDVAYTDNVVAGTAKVTVTGKGACFGNIEKEFTIKGASGDKTTPEAPGAPETEDVADTGRSVTLKAHDGYEYRMGTDGSWQKDNVFDKLEPGQEYDFYQRVAATSTSFASPPSPALHLVMECRHTATEKRNVKPATATKNGYTGDVYCTNCGIITQQGEAIPATGTLKPAYIWDFEETGAVNLANQGTAGGTAALHGAVMEKADIAIGSNKYSETGNSVLSLKGGNKGTSWVELPQNLYSGVSAETGLTWSFWMKADPNVVKYSRLFSSADSSNKNEFAYTPYADDKQWNLIFDDTNKYRLIYGTEPEKEVWNYITVTVSKENAVLYVNGDEEQTEVKEGNADALAKRLNTLASFTDHALGKTTSAWSDKDCAVQLDEVSLYKTALTPEQVADLAKSYGLSPKGPREPQNAAEGTYGSSQKQLVQVSDLTVSSVDGANQVKVWKDDENRYYYSVSRNGKVVIECSALGLTTKDADLTSGMELEQGSIKTRQGQEKYDIIQGSTSKVDKAYKELSFTLKKGNAKVTVYFRVFADGMAYRYEVDGNTASTTETTTVTGEASEFVLPDKGNIWTINMSSTYEGRNYTQRTMASQYDAAADYSTPILASLGEDSGSAWVLLSEANVYNEENPYCGSVFKTVRGEKAFRMRFGRYLKQETDPSMNKKKYKQAYDDIKEVNMRDTFHTPWRTAVIASELEDIANSSLFTDLNPQAEGDFSWVEPGSSVWSWWSSSYDAIEYSTMKDYIDFSAEAGVKYCLVDFGWELWDNYEEKIADLVQYGKEKGVSLLLWYGVNKFDGDHIFDLDSKEAIEEQFAWCERVGVKGVKVDYLNSASQFAMNVMYMLADIAAEHHLVINYHGCINPSGENRTYPNIISSEAVCGMENFKFNTAPSAASMLTHPYARNVLGSMEFTPTGYRYMNSNITSGFMLAQSVVYESAVQTFAHSACVYPGYNGLSLISDVPTTWDESRLIEGYPGKSVIRARRKGANWYLGAMTLEAKTYQVPLDFLDQSDTYHAYIYKDNAKGDDIVIESKEVTSETVLSIPLLANGGCSVKFSKTDPLKTTVYDDYDYYEAEDTAHAAVAAPARVEDNQYASRWKSVGYLGNGGTLTFTINAAKAGEYEMKLYYISGEARDLYISVNDENTIEKKQMLGYTKDWKAVAGVSIPVQLRQGSNTIRFYNDTASAPSIDRIAISKDPAGGNLPTLPKSLSGAQIRLTQEEYIYDGKACEPGVTVTVDGVGLKKDVDYTVAYENNQNVGTARVVITGIGDWTGTAEKTYEIKKKQEENPQKKKTTITGRKSYTKVYGNKAFSLIVSSGAGKKGKLTYQSNNKNVAEVNSAGKVTLKGTGIATITVQLVSDEFTASAYKIAVKVKPSKVTLASAKSKKKKQVSVAWKKLSAKQKVSGYRIAYSTSKKFKSYKKVDVKSSQKSAVLKKLKSKKNYYIKVCAYKKIGKTKLYGTWSKAKRIRVK